MIHHSLLDDPLIRVRFTDESARGCTLPQVLAALTDGDVLAFEALQPHQQQPWFSFLVQLAAMAAAREAGGDLPADASGWRGALLGLAGGSEAAWHLAVEDVSQPAFMQPPVPEGALDAAGYDKTEPTPDRLDMLAVAKNHDVKRQRITQPQIEHWLFALCTVQTMEGIMGRGNYGIVRMNKGYGNRPLVGLATGLSWGERFIRDLDAILNEREALSDRYDLAGHALLWLHYWDGAKSSGIPIGDCDPYFIEICRRIRLQQTESSLTCRRTNTKAQRVDAPDTLRGVTGDPWTPTEKKGAKALTVGTSGFAYDLLQEILLGEEYTRPAALRFRESERGGAYLVARTLVRGKGGTDGLHHRIVPISERVSGRLFSAPSERERLASRAQQRVALAATVQRKVLYPSIAALLSSGRDEKVDWERVRPWTDAFDRAIDARFFESLWASVEMGEDAARRAWQKTLFEEAEQQFGDAEGGTPISAIHRWHARSKAQSIFYGNARKHLNLAFEDAAPAQKADASHESIA